MNARYAVLTVGILSVAILAGCDNGRAIQFDLEGMERGDIYDVPRLAGLAIDGNAGDWGDQGFRVDMLLPEGLPTKTVADHSGRMRLGWTDKGLAVLMNIRDDKWVEDPKDNTASADAVEVCLMADSNSMRPQCKWVIRPGMAKGCPKPTWRFVDRRGDANVPKGATAPTVARTRTDGGYVMEILLPFSCMGIEPEIGRKVGFRLWVNDMDAPGDRIDYRAGWVSGRTQEAPLIHQRRKLRLAETPSPPVRIYASASFDFERLRMPVTVVAAADLAGKEAGAVCVGDGYCPIGGFTLETDATGYVVGRTNLDLPWGADKAGPVAVFIDNQVAASSNPGDFNQLAAETVKGAEMIGWPCVFTGAELPEVDFKFPVRMHELLGGYKRKTTYYDSEYRVVNRADKLGRYGAVVEVRSERFPTFHRFVTLCRIANQADWWKMNEWTARTDLPTDWGISKQAAEIHAEAISQYILGEMMWGMYDKPHAAALLVGLLETKPGDSGGFYNSPGLRDRQWWVGLKRKLYGLDKEYTHTPPMPTPLADGEKPATVVHEGTMVEAGMAKDAPKRIDAALKAWEADTDMAFAVCVVRNGVVVLHKAYGQRAGKPMTVDTPSKVASVTKLMSSTLLAMFLDRGLLKLDEPIATYLPPLRGVEMNKPVTIRNCYTHTAGTNDHWGDWDHDMEERIALVFPHYEVAERFKYNGTGMALTCKAMEAVTGLSQPALFRRCLWEPLGCEKTYTADASGGGITIPIELARLGQLLLNKGAYGDKRFFSEKTFEQMLPRNLSYILGKDTDVVYGLATTWYEGDGLGKGTFGHGSATSTTIRIDPENKLVIVMNRNGRGRNFEKHHPKFIQAVTGSIARPDKPKKPKKP